MTRGVITKQKATDEAEVPRAAFTVREFCIAYRISEDFFWKMRRNGWAPKIMRVGAKVLIPVAAAAEWQRDREAAARDLPVDFVGPAE